MKLTEFVEDPIDLLNELVSKQVPYNIIHFARKGEFDRLSFIDEFRRAIERAKILSIVLGGAVAQEEIAKVKLEYVFISKSFSKGDKTINEYFQGIFSALGINYRTGLEYRGASPPQKVRNLIEGSRAIVAILVKRWIAENTKEPHVPIWLMREIAYGEGKNKPSPILVEEGIRDLAGLEKDHELIYFSRKRSSKLREATLRLLEALHAFKLI